MAAAAADEMIAAVDVADLLVGAGVPFREAHGAVAGLVRVAVEHGPHALGVRATRSWPSIAPGLDPAALRELLRGVGWLESKISAGGTALGARARAARRRARGARAAGERPPLRAATSWRSRRR